MTWHIVSDSSCDLHKLPEANGDITFKTIPFIIRIDDEEYTDDTEINVEEMLARNEASSISGQTSCPSPQHWLDAFKEEGPVIAFAISKGLSGSYNSAVTAKQMILETDPDKQIAIIDTRSTGAELILLMRKACGMIRKGTTVDAIEKELNKTAEKLHVVFALASYRNLIKAGRVNRLVGTIAGHLGIWGLGIGDDNGKIAMRGKARGVKGMLKLMVEEIRKVGIHSDTIIISHCLNEEAAEMLKAQLMKAFEGVRLEVIPMRGLDSYYAERKGLIVAF